MKSLSRQRFESLIVVAYVDSVISTSGRHLSKINFMIRPLRGSVSVKVAAKSTNLSKQRPDVYPVSYYNRQCTQPTDFQL